jgi:uncharacterized protein DUF268
MPHGFAMKVKRAMRSLGFNPREVVQAIRGIPTFVSNRRQFHKQAGGQTRWDFGSDWPCLTDRYAQSGVANGQYFHQDLYVAQQIFERKTQHHVDAGSRVDGFVAHVASFMPVEVLDIRSLSTTAGNIQFKRRDLMQRDESFDNYTDSLSCLHTLEHLGLGRYGDPIKFDGYLDGWESLTRMLRQDGILYFSVPVSHRQRIEFDAHRLFGIPYLLGMIEPAFEICALSIVNDAGDLERDVDPYSPEAARTFGIENGCAVFVLRKK